MSDTGKSSGLPVPMCNQTFPKAKFLTKLNGFWVYKAQLTFQNRGLWVMKILRSYSWDTRSRVTYFICLENSINTVKNWVLVYSKHIFEDIQKTFFVKFLFKDPVAVENQLVLYPCCGLSSWALCSSTPNWHMGN